MKVSDNPDSSGCSSKRLRSSTQRTILIFENIVYSVERSVKSYDLKKSKGMDIGLPYQTKKTFYMEKRRLCGL